MHSDQRIATGRLALVVLTALLIGNGESRADLFGKWIGQDGHDLVGGEPGPAKNDYQDIHLAIKGIPANREVAEIIIHPGGGGEWRMTSNNRFTVLLVRAPKSTSADIYIEPYMREVGRQFEVKIKLDDGQESSAYFPGGKADPNLRVAGTGMAVKWLGQDGVDRTGPSPNVGPEGFEDVHLGLAKLSAQFDIVSVEVTGPGGLAWHFGLNPKAISSAELIRNKDDRSKADFYFSPGRDLAGQTLKVALTYSNERGDFATVVGQKVNPAKAVSRVAVPTLAMSNARAKWLGQDGIETAVGDVHVVIEGWSPNKQLAAAVLSDGAVSTWLYKPSDKVKLEVGSGLERLQIRRDGPTRLDLAFPPSRDESTSTMNLRLIDTSGHEEILRFPGGKCDPDLRAPALPSGTITAKPGDDLNDLATKYGTINLSKGVYPLSKPLILSRTVRIVGEPGSTLLFKQAGDQPPWTSAIKIHAGGTTLEGFAIRFEGEFKWDRDVSYGPAVIGTTDNRDNVPSDGKYGIKIVRLDIQGPEVKSGWEEAVHLIRVVSASSGRIERNTLKGGAVSFAGGPWRITENLCKGTMPNTFVYQLFGARYTHDLTLVGNKLKDEGPSGKCWRFLVLTQRGIYDVIKDNVSSEGVGPREDDAHKHENSPEVFLTEAYRLHFEGKPASISADGRILAIPRPQGDSSGPGDAVAILSGPQAGQWRTIAQTIAPQVFLLDEPIARETDAVSISTAFVRETFEGNTIDCRGSGIADNLVLAGDHFGTRVLRNHLIGGRHAIRLEATPTEQPVTWGWSHAPFLGGLVEGNLIEDCLGITIGVDHGSGIKSNKGRVYLSLTFKDNTFRWTSVKLSNGKPPKVEISTPPSLDPREMVMTEEGTKVEGAPAKTVWVHAATINGKVIKEAPLKPEGTLGARGRTGANPRLRD
jgi:hypothetical protein